MTVQEKSEKPQAVVYAELALWAWTAWTCLFGFLQTRSQIPEIEQAMAGDLQGLISIAPETLLRAAAGGYAAIAAVSAWFIVKLAAGKHWARSSFMWSFVFQVLLMALPPYHRMTAGEFLGAVPDIGLQILALYLLYTLPGSAWFPPKTSPAKKAR